MKKQNRLKFFYYFLEYLSYLKRPFFKFGQKTSQQLTNWSIFLSLFVMSLSLAQTSLETRNFAFFNNYPIFVKNKKIPQKFETFYLQLPSATDPCQEFRQKVQHHKREKAERVWYKQLWEEKKGEQRLFIDFHKYLDEGEPTYPTTFEKIQNPRQKQDAINLYQTFEQIAPMLLAENVREIDEKTKTKKQRQKEKEAIFMIGGHVSDQNWSSKTENFEKKKAWRFFPISFRTFTYPCEFIFYRPHYDKKVTVYDYKEEDKNLMRSSNFVDKFLSQYRNFIKKNENYRKFYLNNCIFPFPKIEITQKNNNTKIILSTFSDTYKQLLTSNLNLKQRIFHFLNPFWSLSFSKPPTKFDQLNMVLSPPKNPPKEKKKIDFTPLEDTQFTPLTLPYKEKVERIQTGFENVERMLQYIIAPYMPKWESYAWNVAQDLINEAQYRMLSGKQYDQMIKKIKKQKEWAKIMNQPSLIDLFRKPRKNKKKRTCTLPLTSYQTTYLILKTLHERPRKIRVPTQFEQHKAHIKNLEAKANIPWKEVFERDVLDDFEENIYQLPRIKDRIPQKLAECRLDPIKKKRKASIFIKDTEYYPAKIDYMVHKKASLKHFITTLANTPLYNPCLIRDKDNKVIFNREFIYSPHPKSLFRVEMQEGPSVRWRENMFQFLDLIVKQYPEFQDTHFMHFYKMLRRYQKYALQLVRSRSRWVMRNNQFYEKEAISIDEMEALRNRDPQALRRYGYPANEVGERFLQLSKRGMIYYDDFSVLFSYELPGTGGEYMDPTPVQLETLEDFMKWRSEKSIKTADLYFHKFSAILKKIKKNHYFDFHFLAEDFLLEAILLNIPHLFQDFKKFGKGKKVSQKKNVSVSRRINKRRKIHKKNIIQQKKEEIKTEISFVARKLLNFFDKERILGNDRYEKRKKLINLQKKWEQLQRRKTAVCQGLLCQPFNSKMRSASRKILKEDFQTLESMNRLSRLNLQIQPFYSLRDKYWNRNWQKIQKLQNALFLKWEKFEKKKSDNLKFFQPRDYPNSHYIGINFTKVNFPWKKYWNNRKEYWNNWNRYWNRHYKYKRVKLFSSERYSQIAYWDGYSSFIQRDCFPFENRRLWIKELPQTTWTNIRRFRKKRKRKSRPYYPRYERGSISPYYCIRRVLPKIPKNKDALIIMANIYPPLFKSTKEDPYVFRLKNISIQRPWKVNKFLVWKELCEFIEGRNADGVKNINEFQRLFGTYIRQVNPKLYQYYLEIDNFQRMEDERFSVLDGLMSTEQLAIDEKERQSIREKEMAQIERFVELYQHPLEIQTKEIRKNREQRKYAKKMKRIFKSKQKEREKTKELTPEQIKQTVKKTQTPEQKRLIKKNNNKNNNKDNQNKDNQNKDNQNKDNQNKDNQNKVPGMIIKLDPELENKMLARVTAEIMNDFVTNDPAANQYQRQMRKKKKIYETSFVRDMSGYSFPDLKNQKFDRIFQQDATLELSLSNKDVNLSEFTKKFPKNRVSYVYPLRHPSPPFQSFQNRQKISKIKFWDSQFFEHRENIENSSWSVLFFLSSGWIFVNQFKNLYKKYAKEFVESGLDILKRLGLLDDIQWIKEELGLAPIDKGYRGIRQQSKKLKNIIGINQKQKVLQISEIVWFLKTKKLLRSTTFDPFLLMILLIHRSEFLVKTKKYLLLQQMPKRGLPPSLYQILVSYHARTKTRSVLKRTSRRFFPLTALGPSPTERQYEINKRLDQNKRKIPPTKALRPLSFRFKKARLMNIPCQKFPTGKETITIKPKGYLLTGPPGTGKTLLVQAMAGETGVPVVTQSGGLLQKPRFSLGLQGCGTGAKTLHKLFLRAREIAPCIIFIDEIDGIGKRRQFFTDGRYDPVEWLEGDHPFLPPNPVPQKIQRRPEFFDDHDPYWDEPEFTQTVQSTQIPMDLMQDMQSYRAARTEQVNILTQLLIELDGIHSLDNIVVLGATNRLEILDPALMRPGRFQKTFRFYLPDYGARMNLLKFYTHHSKIGVDNLSWDYFAKRTNGLSSADIASIVFASELTAIEKGQKHTFETLERGIDLITSFPCDPIMFRLKNIFMFLETSVQEFYAKREYLNSFSPPTLKKSPTYPTLHALQEISTVLRHCYYNIGKMVLLFYLEQEQMPLAYISLWKRPKNFRFFFFTKNFHEFEELDQKRITKIDIEKRLLSLYGGKAGESFLTFLPLQIFTKEIYFQFDSTFLVLNNSVEQSNLGMDGDLQSAQRLLKLMVEEWYFYLERVAAEKFHPILENVNLWEYMGFEADKHLVFGETLVEEMLMNLDMRNRLTQNNQKHSYRTWWMKKVATQLNFRESWRSHLQWSRIYLSDADYSPQNIEWVPPDEYFHTTYRTCPQCMSWSHYLENRRFALSNILLLQSFNGALKLLRPFLEFIDFLSDYFLRQGCIREKEFQLKIEQFFSDFGSFHSIKDVNFS